MNYLKKSRSTVLFCLLIVPFFAAGAESAQSTDYQIEIAQIKIEPFRMAQGKEVQILLVDWKNTGKLPVGLVKAELSFFDSQDRKIDQIKSYRIFTALSAKAEIKPGTVYREPKNDGFVIIPVPETTKAARATVKLTLVGPRPLY
jgi:hypothetical protein